MNTDERDSGEPARLADERFEDEIDLRDLVAVLLAGKWWIAGTTLLFILGGIAYALAQDPVYQADALLQIEEQSASLAGMEALEELTGREPQAAAQIEIMRSRSVLGTAVDEEKLQISAEPRRVPVLYRVFRNTEGVEPAEAMFGLDAFDWGGSAINVTRFEVPERLQGEEFTLVAGQEGQYTLQGPEGATVLEGRVDETAETEDGRFALFVAELTARPSTEFRLVRSDRQSTISNLRSRLQASEQGDRTGIVRLQLEGEDAQQIEEVLNAVTNNYLRQNVERRSAEARERLEFLQAQLPELRGEVEQAEQQLSEYQQQEGTIDLGAQTEKLLEQIVDVESRIGELETRLAEARQSYGSSHPVIEGLDARMESLQSEKSELEEEVESLPDRQREMLSLRRELEVSTEVYTQMLNTSQELRVAEAGAIGEVYIVDQAETGSQPIAPRRSLILVLSAFLGGMLGCGGVLGHRALRRGVDNAADLEKQTGIAVYAVIPHSSELTREERRFRRGRRDDLPLLANEASQAAATEAMRSLRTALHFGLRDPARRVIALTSATPEAGKSVTAANMALLLAEAGQSVVVIDGDMRRGHLHQYIARDNVAGLADVLAGTHTAAQVVRTFDEAGRASLISRGTTPPNPSELLLNERFEALLGELQAMYDWVIIDAPPVMAVTDAAIIGHAAATTFVIVRAHRDDTHAVTDAVRRLQQNDVRVAGLVLNNFGAQRVGTTYPAYYYQYDYSNKDSSRTRSRGWRRLLGLRRRATR